MHPIARQLNIPNSLTLLRLVLVPVVVRLLTVGYYDWALWVFIAAALSDALDGFLARVLDQRTELGATLDPIADKLMLLSTLAVLVWLALLPGWLLGAIVLRDAVIIGGALAYRHRAGHLEVAPTWLGKFHTLLEFALAGLVIADAAAILPLAAWLEWLFGLVLVTALTSGAQYVWLWGRRAAAL
ncbi:CDP-alcohol phosphatidyltransferase [Sulfuriferula plumbiphila]|uniref:CDP-diacylglycerol--glycerol-3-phosphate 3-phosphatidyltransferase n=1 Tax=Sulfuriferula plumbiphila TaxID=171865 RepID=A0A512L873_9PROT|nr:CDP-alcohol phosphatidyltransferase family protein [Sulfuriferula plumbiphila]BBP05304.1 CDP-alcohol phosphatidyltransferase [Sulfuriferula plumbiphila]GEP30341.1 CDP-alcohol phosphatidyltransferase [Sulfuriferula plumbiphila]